MNKEWICAYSPCETLLEFSTTKSIHVGNNLVLMLQEYPTERKRKPPKIKRERYHRYYRVGKITENKNKIGY